MITESDIQNYLRANASAYIDLPTELLRQLANEELTIAEFRREIGEIAK